MWVVDVPPVERRSVQPTGGTPRDDAAYLAWRDALLIRAADFATPESRVDALAEWKLDAYLFDRLGGSMPLLDQITYAHRLRFLGIALRTRRRVLTRLALRFVDEALNDDGR